MRRARILILPLILVLLVCALALLSPLPAQPSPQTLNVTFTTIDVPGAGYTGVNAINTAGDMVGNYGQSTDTDSHGFLYSNGTFTYFDYPDGQNKTIPLGINDSGLISGYSGNLPVVGFIYDGTTFTTIKDGSDTATFVQGINNKGDVVGGSGTIFTTKGFRMRGGRFMTLNFPGVYTYASASAINNLGMLVGSTSSPNQAYLYKNGQFKNIDFPGANNSEAFGINDSGLAVGWYDSPGCFCAFVYKNGKFTSFSYPGAAFTEALGINNLGQIVGAYTFDFQEYHGFVTNPVSETDFR